MADPSWPQFDAGRPADEYMPSSADVLAEIQAAERALRERHGERITRITVGPALAAWLKRKLPPAEPPLIPAPFAGLLGIPVVEDPAFVNGRLRIHRGAEVEDWFAIPADEPEQLVRLRDPVVPYPQFNFWSEAMAWTTGPFGPLQSAVRAQSAQIAANDETLRRMRAEADEGVVLASVRLPWWRRVLRRR